MENKAKNIWSIVDQVNLTGKKSGNKWAFNAEFSTKTMKDTIREMVEMINFIIATDDKLCQKINANIYFNIKFSEKESIKHTVCIISHRNKTKDPPREVSIEVNPITFILLLSGKIEGAVGFLEGNIKFIGSANLPLAIQMQQVLSMKLDQLRSGELMEKLKANL